MFPRDPNEPRFITWMRNPRVRRIVMLGVLWIFMVVVLVQFRIALLPLGLAILLAFIIEPAVELLTGRGVLGRRIPRIAAVLIVYACALTVFTAFGSWAVAQIARELSRLGALSTTAVEEARAALEALHGQSDDVISDVSVSKAL